MVIFHPKLTLKLIPKPVLITYSDIPYKCSHFAEIENSKIFDFNHFFLNRKVNYYSRLLNFDVYFNPQRSYSVFHSNKRTPFSWASK
jgi:hypothetical protein